MSPTITVVVVVVLSSYAERTSPRRLLSEYPSCVSAVLKVTVYLVGAQLIFKIELVKVLPHEVQNSNFEPQRFEECHSLWKFVRKSTRPETKLSASFVSTGSFYIKHHSALFRHCRRDIQINPR